PAIAAGPDGAIAVSYYDFRFNDANPGLLTDRWVVFCKPSRNKPCTDPANWGNETRLTNTSFDLETALFNAHGLWIGDYEGLAAAGSGFVAVWTQPHGSDRDGIF